MESMNVLPGSGNTTSTQFCPSDPAASNSCKTKCGVGPSIGAYVANCAYCYKWRVIPEKRKYMEIRENILEIPFVCEMASEWRPNIMCSDPSDVDPDDDDEYYIWAIDIPNIPLPPQGWDRLVRYRGKGGVKFADVFYEPPPVKTTPDKPPRPNGTSLLRSAVEIQKYLLMHPTLGGDISQFSFQIPKPLNKSYVRKRTRKPRDDGANLVISTQIEPSKEVNTSAWEAPVESRDFEAPIFHPVGRPAKIQVRRPRS